MHDDQQLRARIWAHDAVYFGTMSSPSVHDGWCSYRNPDLAGRYDPNHVGLIRLHPEHVTGFVSTIIAEADADARPAVVYRDADARPHTLHSDLCAAGFVRMHDAVWDVVDLMTCTHAAPVVGSGVVSRVDCDADAAAWAALHEPDPYTPPEIMARLRRAEIADSRVTAWLISVDQHPVGRCLSFIDAGLGRVESVFVHPDARCQGLATALVGHVTAHIAANGAVPYLFALHDGGAHRVYHRLGYRVLVHDAVETYVRAFRAS
ncbi:MAG: FR47-like protein [Chloroflexota bacterium]|jgi:GNAT superfamily N-acetyltransferase